MIDLRKDALHSAPFSFHVTRWAVTKVYDDTDSDHTMPTVPEDVASYYFSHDRPMRIRRNAWICVKELKVVWIVYSRNVLCGQT